MYQLQQILTIAGAVLGILVTATGFLIPLIKNAKARKALETINKISTQIQPYVVKAEEFTHFSGIEKKQYVMTALNEYAIQNKLPFNAEIVSNLIEEVVKTSKQVNAKTKEQSENPNAAQQGA